jgi:hypothetical protein
LIVDIVNTSGIIRLKVKSHLTQVDDLRVGDSKPIKVGDLNGGDSLPVKGEI